MFLEVVSLARDISHDGLSRRQFDSRDLTVRGVGLLGLRDEDLADNALLVRVALQERRLRLLYPLLGFPACGLI